MGNKQPTKFDKLDELDESNKSNKNFTDEQKELLDRYVKNPFVVFDKDDKKIKVVIPINYDPITFLLIKSFDVNYPYDNEDFFSVLKEALEMADRGKEKLKQLFN
jgi:hypothetical protein